MPFAHQLSMPLLQIKTSSPAPADRDALLLELSQQLAGWLGKPERSVMTLLEAGVAMTFAGDTAPCAYVEVKSIGGLDGDRPARITAALCDLLERRLGVGSDRMYICFSDAPAQLWGWNGSTFG
jgi:phenylpyruvate tautomerase